MQHHGDVTRVEARRQMAKESTGRRSYTAVATKVAASTGRAAWVAGTSLLVLLVPLIIEMDREQQLVEMESQQMDVLGGSNAHTGTQPSSSSNPSS